MKRNILWLVISCLMQWVNCSFYHEPSFKFIEDTNEENERFGYALGYQEHGDKLVVGAPNTATGEIYSCPKSSILDGESCKPKKEMDSKFVENMKHAKRVNSDYKFKLGTSIAIVNESIVTCAPMWSGNYKDKASVFDNLYEGIFVWGACFEVKDENVNVIGGVYGHPRKESQLIKENRGSFGWRTLVDAENKLILISKPASPPMTGDIAFINIKKNGLSDMRSLIFNDDNFVNIIAEKRTYMNALAKHRNIGAAMASGKFWELTIGTNKVLYAASFTLKSLGGGVIFLIYQNSQLHLLLEHGITKKPLQLEYIEYVIRNNASSESKPINVMFGAALCAVKIYGGRYTDLVVGAPTQHGTAMNEPELGAVHVYKGSFKRKDFMTRKLKIMSVTEESRFGSSIVANDLDGDGSQELFISAPYENEGVVYILSGSEISQQTEESVDVTAFKYKQIIKKEGFKTLGFSMLTLPDLDENGCDEIAIGAPESNKVLVLRCIPTVTITVTTSLMDYKIIPEIVNDFKINVCVNIDFKSKMERIAASVTLDNKITGHSGKGVGISWEPKSLNFDLSSKEKQYCDFVKVHIEDNKPGRYTFSSEAKLITDAAQNDVFNPSWVRNSPNSLMKKKQSIQRACSGAGCDHYDLRMEFLWSGGEIKEGYKYHMDSKKDEVLTLRVSNEGIRIAFTACALVNIVGAPVNQLECPHVSGGYLCRLSGELMKGTSRDIQMKLKMTDLTNEFTGLDVNVRLYADCDEKEDPMWKEFKVEYEYTTDQIQIQNSSKTSSITEKSLKSSSETIEVTHVYKISNKGRLLWKEVEAEISMGDPTIVKGLVVSSEKTKIDTKTSIALFQLDLNPLSTVKLVVTALLWKNQIEERVMKNNFEINSVLSLNIPPTSASIKSSVTSKPTYEKDTTIGQDKILILILSIVGAILFLALLSYICYKRGFFKREKKELLKAEIRRSIRRSQNPPSVQIDSSVEVREEQVDDENALCSTDRSDIPRQSLTKRASRASRRMSYQNKDEIIMEKKSE